MSNPSRLVLVVSEFNDELVLLADLLIRARRRILWQTNCRDALRSIAERPIDLVLCARTLADGGWSRIQGALARLRRPPRLVVVLRDGDLPVQPGVSCLRLSQVKRWSGSGLTIATTA